VKAFEEEDIEMFEMVASLCSMAIDNASMLERVRKDYLNTIKTLAKVIDANDKYTRGHCDKVMKYSLLICRQLKLSERHIKTIKTASLLHDIGKIGIDLSILRKEGKLTAEDWEKVRMHPEIGAKIIAQVGFLNDLVPIIQHHHERFEGGGYPDPTKCDGNIPLGARIIAVADAFDAMTSDRPYRKAMPEESAFEELKRCAGSQFDPEVVKAFLSAIKV
jgi:putative nucleotidyltransferase with HDIG domain